MCQCLSEVGRVLCNNDSSNPESTDLYGMAKEWGTTVQKMEGTTPGQYIFCVCVSVCVSVTE